MVKIEKYDCKYLDGYRPCHFHKEKKVPCSECPDYEPLSLRILIIKLGAAGEVIRNTPILHKLRERFPTAEITWLTNYPELIPQAFVDRIVKYNLESSISLTEEQFDLLLSLDKETCSCAMANKIQAKVKKGFYYSPLGKILPFDSDAARKWMTGIDDNEMLKNDMHYVEEVFEICGYEWRGEKYILPQYPKSRLFDFGQIIVGLITGTSHIWKTRIPHIEKIEEILQLLISKNYKIVLLGGPEEDQKNIALKNKYKVHYFGVNPIEKFINIMDNCDVIITPVTMGLHLAIGLNKNVILLNNIFNKNEFYLYEKGTIIEPPLSCTGCYKKEFDEHCPVKDCTLLYDSQMVVQYIETAGASLRK